MRPSDGVAFTGAHVLVPRIPGAVHDAFAIVHLFVACVKERVKEWIHRRQCAG